MRVIVFFDLPVQTKKDRKTYATFRKDLIKMGFSMIQFSVYGRTVKNSDDASKYERRIEAIVPEKGSVRLMIVTEKQYTNIKILAGEKMKSENLLDTKDILEL